MANTEGLKEAWLNYNHSSLKEKVLLDQIVLLSLADIEYSTATLRIIDPCRMRWPPEKRVTKIQNLPQEALNILRKTGFAFFYNKRIFLTDDLFSKTLNDIFGLSGAALEPSWPRDLHIAGIMQTLGEAYVTYYRREGYNVISSTNTSSLDKIETNLFDLAESFIEEGAELYGWNSHKSDFEIELSFPVKMDGWDLHLVMKDSCIGRTSMTFYSAWRKDSAVVYVDTIRKRHRTQAVKEDIMNEIRDRLKKAENTGFPDTLTYPGTVKKIASIIGKSRAADLFSTIGSKTDKNGEVVLRTIAGYPYVGMNDQKTAELRLTLGELMKNLEPVKEGRC